jgi:uncharacterized membrane protein
MSKSFSSSIETRKGFVISAGTILVASFLSKLMALHGTQLFRDEANSFFIASCKTVSEILYHLRYDGNAPLYPILLHFWMSLFGMSEFSAQMFSVLLALSACAFVGALAADFFGKETGIVALLLTSIYSVWIYDAIQIRPYALLIAATSMALWMWCRLLRDSRNSWRSQLIFIFGSLIMLYTHPWGVFAVFSWFVAAWIDFILFKKGKEFLFSRLFWSFVIIGFGYLPLFIIQIFQAKENVAPFAVPATIEGVFNHFFFSRHSLYYLNCLILVDFLVLFARRASKNKTIYFWKWHEFSLSPIEKLVVTLLLWVVILIVVAATVSKFVYCWTGRYTVIITPSVLSIAAFWFFKMWTGNGGFSSSIAKTLIVLAMIAAIGTIIMDYVNNVYVKSNSKSAATYIQKHYHSNDFVIVSCFAFSPSISFYLPKEVSVIAYPQGKRVEIMHWSGISEQMEDSSTLNMFFQKISNHSFPGTQIYFIDPFYQTVNEWGIRAGLLKPPTGKAERYLYNEIRRTVEIDRWLQAHCKRIAMFYPDPIENPTEAFTIFVFTVEKKAENEISSKNVLINE